MKKYTFLFAVIATLALAACGSGSSTNTTKDSTGAKVDSAAVKSADSTAQPADSSAGGAKKDEPAK